MNTTALLLAVAVLNEVKENNIQLGDINIDYRNGAGIRIITIIVPREDGKE